MPETEGQRLLRLLLARYPRPTDASRAMGWPDGRVDTYKNRGGIPPKEWDRVRAAVDPASTTTSDGALDRLKNQPDLLAHLARQTELLALIPALRTEVEALRAEIATLRASSADAAAPDLVALVRARFGPKTARAVARVLGGGGVRRVGRNQGTSR